LRDGSRKNGLLVDEFVALVQERISARSLEL